MPELGPHRARVMATMLLSTAPALPRRPIVVAYRQVPASLEPSNGPRSRTLQSDGPQPTARPLVEFLLPPDG